MNISTFQSNLDFIKNLYFREEWKDRNCRKEILAALEEANTKIEKAFGESLHRLYDHKPSIKAVGKVVKKFPSTLSYADENGQIPIQWAAADDGFEYVPILAKEGIKHEVGGEDARGGLLMIDPSSDEEVNSLQWLVYAADEDEDRLRVLKELQKSGLLVKKDIQEQNLMFSSFCEGNQMRFEYLADWDPNALIETRIRDKPLIHHIIASQSEEAAIILALKNGFKYHPSTGGLLFVENDNGTTAFDCLCNKIGEEKAMSLLHEILTPDCKYPILHHVFIKAPQEKDIFMEKFPPSIKHYHIKTTVSIAKHTALLFNIQSS
ncbi:hypothetical protein CTEN210_00555 [Chaetoceros tenuissimus]|uniref:Uncharacterized protein n=1 Tax=Chaetoceros tenuissimus TaxID=426638 RepID=A0AAD3CE17_9STRA|nr:hypothetical protein CTEN210_00555 [Chaetoceros tenuissimus]